MFSAAPVTRLRRRLSVEPEDSPLPTTPSTPSKKRTTRLAAKPQLELIDEVGRYFIMLVPQYLKDFIA